jgi:hypothetical protein
MAQLTIDQIKDLDIPKNVSRKKNNLLPASRSVVLYNDSINLYEAIKLVSTDLINTLVTSVTTEQIQDVVGALIIDSSTIDFTYNDGANTLSAAVIPSAIDHDALLNFVANEHIDHSTVSILAGTGLTGGGDLTTSRTLSLTNTGVTAGTYGSATAVPVIVVDAQGRLTSVTTQNISLTTSAITDFTETLQDTLSTTLVAGSGITLSYNDIANTLTITSSVTSYTDEQAQDAVGSILQDSSTIDFTYNDPSGTITASVITGAIDHDALLNFVANEHIDHSAVSILAGTGLTGGGNLTASRTLTIADTGVTAAAYGDASNIATFTVNAQGQLTAAAAVPVLIGANQVSNFDEAVDDRVAALLVAGSNITLTYNDAANTLTIASSGGGGGTITGGGAANQVTYWSTATSVDGDSNFLWDGTALAINQTSIPSNSILNTQGLTTSSLSSGYTHNDSTGTPVFRVADDGSIYLGDGIDPLSIGDWGMTKGDTFYFSTSTDKIRFVPGTFVHVQGPMAINTSTIGSDKLRVNGQTRIDLGSDAEGDIFYRTASGHLARLPIGTGSQVLMGGTIPSWGTVSGSLPGGVSGDIAIHDGTGWASVSRTVETQTGISGTLVTLASTPLSYAPKDIYKNGLLQVVTDDYTMAGANVTFVNSLSSTDKVTAIYYL